MASPKPYVVWGRHYYTQVFMYYTYVLKSKKDERFYIGYSANLKKRLEAHQEGRVTSTKNRRPLKLIFYEAFSDKKDAHRREKYFKSEEGKSSLKQIIRFSGN